MHILHLSTSDISGGAAISAYNLHRALLQSNIDSKMLVKNKLSDQTEIEKAEVNTAARYRHLLRTHLFKKQIQRYPEYNKSLTGIFTDSTIGSLPPTSIQSQKYDIIHLHWITNFLSTTRLLSRNINGTPIVWTLHDMNPFTGGCHFTFGCNRYTMECGNCPHLKSGKENDISRKILAKKRKLFSTISEKSLRIITPCEWMSNVASTSTVLKAYKTHMIPYCVDTAIFKPLNKLFSRELLSLPKEKPIILFIADSVNDYRKGFDICRQLFLNNKGESIFISVGKGDIKSEHETHIHLGCITDRRLMSAVYSAADVFAFPSRADNAPNVLLEAMSCGLPTVGFKVGGVDELISDQKTGILVAPEDTEGFRRAIDVITTDRRLREKMSRNCRESALDKYTFDRIAKAHIELYRAII